MTLEGYIEQIKYYNEDNGYTVLDLSTEEELTTCCGYFPALHEGEEVTFEGEYSCHSTYGPQFKVASFKLKGMNNTYAVYMYLASGAIKGIGTATASKIVERFKEDTYRILEQEPERLSEIKGISENKARDIAVQLEEQSASRNAMLFLRQYGISIKTGTRIFQYYKEDIYDIIKTNPYQLAMDIDGIGFITADEIAGRIGISGDYPYRIRSGLLYVLSQAVGEGHTYLPYDLFKNRATVLLGTNSDPLETEIDNLLFDGEIVSKKSNDCVRIYLKKLFMLEKDTTEMLLALAGELEFDRFVTEDIIKEEIEKNNLQIDAVQTNAVLTSIGQGLSVITGGPGTGKTTIIKLLINSFNRQGMDVMLAAPTGRAAKRMTEATGYEAKTIHRMLEISSIDENHSNTYFGRNESYPLETDVVIIDEMSMVDIFLMNNLLKAINEGSRLIMVGDMNQLPSVGPGAVLKDIVESAVCPVTELTHIFRQAAESDIVINAHKVKEGTHISLNNKSKDFFFLERHNANVVAESVKYLISKKLPPYVDANPYEIQVVSPIRKGPLGIETLNSILREAINPPSSKKKEKKTDNFIFREGDKVMQIKNNYQIEWKVFNSKRIMTDHGTGVFNGDIGIIKSIDTIVQSVKVIFEDIREIDYDYSQLDELEPAYAITVHKSQGSEYPAVIIPLLNIPKVLTSRNLLYTAITRAKKCVMIVGDSDVLYNMIDNSTELKRYSGLSDCIKEAMGLGER